MTDALAAAIGRHEAEHLRFGPVPRAEIEALEARIGRRLPASLASALETVGNGIFFGKEELFGPRRLMVHDIELVPDLVSFQRHFAAAGETAMADALIPFHRADEVVHLLDLRTGGESAVVSADGGRSYPDLASFLGQVVIPSVLPGAP